MIRKRREVSKEVRGRQLYQFVRLLHKIIPNTVYIICLRSTSFRNTPKPLNATQENISRKKRQTYKELVTGTQKEGRWIHAMIKDVTPFLHWGRFNMANNVCVCVMCTVEL